MQRFRSNRRIFALDLRGRQSFTQSETLAIQQSSHVIRRIRPSQRVLQFSQRRQSLLDGPTEGDADEMKTDDYRIALAAFAVARRPKAPNEELTGTLPKKNVFERGKLLRRLKPFPRARIDLSTDPVYVEQCLGKNEAFGLQPQVLDLIVPSRMLAKDGQPGVTATQAETASVFKQKLFEEFAHFKSSEPS